MKASVDLAVTESIDEQEYYFTLEVGGAQSAEIIESFSTARAGQACVQAPRQAYQRTTQ